MVLLTDSRGWMLLALAIARLIGTIDHTSLLNELTGVKMIPPKRIG
jgi:hypothetical protein